MRKTSQDGGDATSITSSVENEIKKSTGIAKMKRSSIKRKVQNFSNESDDGVGEPLLQKEKSESLSQTANKYLLLKTKNEIKMDKDDDKNMLLSNDNIEKSTTSSFSNKSDILANGSKEHHKSFGYETSTIRNHMNTNVFGNPEGIKNVVTPKTQILVEIECNKPGSYNTGSLIFTTAKIHTDGTNKHLEPVQVTTVPILSTVEGSVIKCNDEHTITGTSSTIKNKNNLSGDYKKSVSELNTVIQIEPKELASTTAYSLSPVSKGVSYDKTKQDNNVQNILNKSSTTTVESKLSQGISYLPKVAENKSQNEPVPKTSSAVILNDTKTTRPGLQHDDSKIPFSNSNKASSSVMKMDINKNIESNLPRPTDNVKNTAPAKDLSIATPSDKSAKTDYSAGYKQLQRQKTLKDNEDIMTEPISSLHSEPPKMKNLITTAAVNIATRDKNNIATNAVSKTTYSTAAVAEPTLSATKSVNVSTAVSTTTPASVHASTAMSVIMTSSTGKPLTSTRDITLEGANITSPLSVNTKTMSITSQVKPTTISSCTVGKPTSTVVGGPSSATSSVKASGPMISMPQVTKTSTVPVLSQKPPSDIAIKTTVTSQPKREIQIKQSTNFAQSDKSATKPKTIESVTSSSKPNVSTSKTIEILPSTASHKSPIIISTPTSTIISSNAVHAVGSSTTKPSSNLVTLAGSASNNVHDNKTIDITPRVSGANTVKTTTSTSHMVTPTIKSAINTSTKIPQTTIDSQVPVATGKVTSTLSKTTSSNSKLRTNVTSSKTAQPSTTKTNNTQAGPPKGGTSVKSPTTPTTFSSTTQKPPAVHNQTQRSETKKEKLKK